MIANRYYKHVLKSRFNNFKTNTVVQAKKDSLNDFLKRKTLIKLTPDKGLKI